MMESDLVSFEKKPCNFCSQSSFCSTNKVDAQSLNSVILAAYSFVPKYWIKFPHYFHNPYMSGQVRVFVNVTDFNFQKENPPHTNTAPFQEKGK